MVRAAGYMPATVDMIDSMNMLFCWYFRGTESVTGELINKVSSLPKSMEFPYESLPITETKAEEPEATGASPLPKIMLVVALIGPEPIKIV